MESEKTDVIEGVPAHTEVLSKGDLRELIYKGESSPQDKRFLPVDRGGVFKYFSLEEMINIFKKTELFYPVARLGTEVVGIAGLEVDPYKEKNIWIKFVSVDPKYQGMGYASQLIEQIFSFAKEMGYSVETSYYTEQGNKLKTKVHEMAQKHGVELIDLH